MKPDVIVCWPKYADYPLWRQFIRDERERFARIIVAFTDHDGPDRSWWVTDNLPEVNVFLEPRRQPKDWRDEAVNAALDQSDAEWVWFTEQDFLIHNPDAFWPAISLGSMMRDAVGIREVRSHRWHPACLFVKRKTIDETDRYFGPDPVDHFFDFGIQLRSVWDLRRDGGLREPVDFEHLQGTSQNQYLVEAGEDAGVFGRERFREYLRASLAADVPLEPSWVEWAMREVRE